ncbi:hypothetical protein ANCCAN_28832 [Ancylostoma caninum]|uniref:Uncharacterized protein n=1 Tax=Ancylostoma caninum TaxID=29170 RepID=A0A368F3H2_ANCCA|nr:hypothetical protein ANCCAN_28832 [Ancylostoma caninum]
MEDNEDRFPPTRDLGQVGPVQYHFLVDSGFGRNYRMILHNLVSRRKDALQDVERYPRYDGVLTPLENIPMGVGQASAELAKDRITQHYDMLYN